MDFIKGIGHVALQAGDVDAAVRFYCDGLGLTLKQKDDHNAIITTPDRVILEIFPGTAQWDRGGITHICLNTYDVDAAFARALEHGAVCSRPQDPEPYTYRDLRMAFVRTPSGEEVEFWGIQKPDGGFGEPVMNGKYVKNFVHVALTVPDMYACVRFYEGLGAKLKIDWEWGCSMILPDGREFELFTGGEAVSEPKAYTHMCLLTEDVDGAMDQVVALGGNITQAPYDWGGLRIGFATGLAGETIEFFHLHPDAREETVFTTPPARLPDLFTWEK